MANIKQTIVRIGAGIFGVIALASGGKMIWDGASEKLGETVTGLGDPQVLAVLDNDFRFLAGVWMIIGLGLLVGSVLIEKKPDLIQIGLEAIFLGGSGASFCLY